MTGRYEEPETRRDLGTASSAAAGDAMPGDGGSGQSAPPSGGNGGYVDPATSPARPKGGDGEHPVPSYVDPANPVVGGGPSGPYAVDGGQQPPYFVDTPSGGQPAAGPYLADPSAPQVGFPPQGTQSGPYPVADGQSGPYPVAPQQQPSPYLAPTQQQLPGAGGEQPFGQDLSSSQLLRQSKRPPQSGWRKAVYLASGKTVNLGESRADLHRRELITRINQPLQGCYKIAMLSLKGGVGKTTTTATLGSTFASLRGDRVIAVDANPDRGTLSQKIPLETTATVRHLLRDAHRISRYSDIRAYTSQGPSRIEILASEQDPAVSEAFSEDDYRRTVTILEHFYNVVLTDCGTGLMHSAMKGVLDVADSLILVSSSSIDGARSASATLDWLDAHGYGELVARSVAVINSVRPGSGKVDVDKLAAHFGSRCRAVVKIPFDPHLEEGAEIELDQLAGPTRLALLELGAVVADDFPQASGRQRGY